MNDPWPNHPLQLLRKLIQENKQGNVMSKYLKFDQIAGELGLPVRTVYYLNQAGLGPKCMKVGRTFLVSREDYETWLQERQQD
jgi:hypothetical protein